MKTIKTHTQQIRYEDERAARNLSGSVGAALLTVGAAVLALIVIYG
jgi:hypothetical protein